MANKQFNSIDGYSVGNATVIIDNAGNVSATSQITRNGRNVPTHVFQANTPPSNALVGDQWYNTTNGILFEYLNDGTTLQWVDVNGQPGVIASMTTANTVTNNAQANITSVGTLTTLTVSGNVTLTGANVSLGNVSNLKITGGTTGQVLSTDGAGNLSWIDAGSGGIQSNTAGIAGADVVTNIVSLTQAEYDAIVSPDASTLYIITD